jgi:hypothetical protein
MKRLTTGAAAALLALVVTGCGESGGGDAGGSTTGTTASSEAASGGGDAVGWADGVCTGMKEHVTALTTTPDVNQTDPAAVKEALLGYLETVTTSLDGMAGVFEDAGAPPVEGGDEVVEGFVNGMTEAEEALRPVQAEIEAAQDLPSLQTAATSIGSAMSAVGDPMASIESNAELKAAFDEAPACKELNAS